jgi:hypothetical protein
MHKPLLALLFFLALTCHAPVSPLQADLPDTSRGIHVFNDQIDVHQLSDAQAAFAATHYAGAQKLTRSGAQRLRAVNPDFVVLHYRLGIGLGYRRADAACQPTGPYLAHINGDDWVRDWPGDGASAADWFYHYNGQRVYWCTWGWYLMDTDHPDWRDWWQTQAIAEITATGSDGLFADSVTVPNYLGADEWQPALPAYDEVFEAEWTRRLNEWMAWANTALGEHVLVVNAGQLVTTRETTDYSLADGVMVEGFAGWEEGSRFALSDWQLQLQRVLDLVNQERIVILQSYVTAPAERRWVLANYLLVKGGQTYVNLEASQGVEWFPEYDLSIGTPRTPLPAELQDLRNDAGLYARRYSNGLILVNPDPDGPPLTMPLETPLHLVTGATGGGEVPANADIAGWGVETHAVTAVTVGPGEAAILLVASPNPSATGGTPAPVAAVSAELAAVHRRHQTFLTWPEIPGDLTMTYQVYRHTAPITRDTLAQAQLIADVPQGSGIFWTERARAVDPPYEDGRYQSLRNYVITDGGPELPDGTGLFVWTPHTSGTAYYAVRSRDGAYFAATDPVAEQTGSPAPVLAWQSPDRHSRVYTQFMDYAAYNPTFDAPRPGNGWMGLPNWAELERAAPQQQYAYNYWVGLPTAESCGGTVPDELPLILHLEGWGTRYAAPDSAPYWCAIHLWGDDPNQSWYFGFSATHDYHTGEPVTTGPVVNYTEARLLQAVRDVIAGQTAPAVDTERIYVYGHSMGGTGALMLAERYPAIFAAAAASAPMMNFAASDVWRPELAAKWGDPALNLPVEMRGPDAAPLLAYQGTGVWDWQNLAGQLSARRGDGMAFIAIAHGTQDMIIDWQTVVQPAYRHFYDGSRAFIGEILAIDHTWLAFRDHPNWRFEEMAFRRDESLPALSHASGSLPMPPPGTGGYNLTVEWSASWHDFAGPPVDTPDEWAVALRSMAGSQTLDVTPRRLQQFAVQPSQTYTWQTVRLADGTVLQSGTVTVDADGLLTVRGITVDEGGCRLTITRQ